MNIVAKSPRAIRLHGEDNVVVAVDQLLPGAVVHGVAAAERVPRGHKMAIAPIAAGAPVRKYGQIIGFASKPIEPGNWLHEHNVEMHDFARDYRFAEDAVPVATAAPAEVRGGHERILLVEDDVSVRRAAMRVLQRFGYEVVAAEDGADALTVIGMLDGAPDLIISDVVMPHTSGPQLLSALREGGTGPRVLLTSGYAARSAQERTMLGGDVPFLAKPWTIEELLRKVREVLEAPPLPARSPSSS